MSDTAGERPTPKPGWVPLGAAALIVPTALAGITLAWPRPQIEAQLTQAATSALQAAGIPSSGVTFHGRDAVLAGVPADARDRAQAVLAQAAGVRVAEFSDAAAPAGPAAVPAAPGVPAAPFGIEKTDNAIVLTGTVGSAADHDALIAAAAAQTGGKSVVDHLTVTPGATLPAGLDAGKVQFLAGTLNGTAGDVSLTLGPDGATLTGTAADEGAKKVIGDRVAAALGGLPLDNRLAVRGSTELPLAAKQQLQGQLAALQEAAPITFGPNTPQLTPEGAAAVTKVLDLLKAAPGARVQVDGYVASGPGNGALTAQQLSDQRAAAVHDLLVAGGVPADHIATRGLGEGATPAKQAAGRRVVITVV